MIILGIDPGLSGAIGVINSTGLYVDAMYMPTRSWKVGKKIHNKVDAWEVCRYLTGGQNMEQMIAGIEAVHSMPHQGISSAFSFGKGTGILIGILAALNISFEEIPPQTWKKYFKLSSNKNDSIIKANQLWPNLKFTKKKEEAKAEALLIAEYTRLKFIVGAIK